ncbi:MAG TPA: prepilin-type N-terminal cleavage/methylation domain-containing protein [Candidatus Sulfotelmatobacter sp.]|jgi:prepilin-type processing-associated H-X9-DG protein|nr:prepilin-type N-terminal cleavage/methylation domain-containing protein [Candidatus Sulfotelmatobacter sp.]
MPIPTKTDHRRAAFALVEAMVVIAIIGIIAALLLPALNRARARGMAIVCLNNTRQLNLGWQLYVEDHDGLLPCNFSMAGTSFRTNLNWVNNVMTSDLSPDNTNTDTITQAALGSYVSGTLSVYRCPSDYLLSPVQSAAGWDNRLRSYAMNGLMGQNETGPSSANAHQFLKVTDVPKASDIFVFLDENPNNLNDGSFALNKTVVAGTTINNDTPAIWHNNSSALSFTDGHVSLHRWQNANASGSSGGTVQSSALAQPASTDLQWLSEHMGASN